jgi:hypothetical protein
VGVSTTNKRHRSACRKRADRLEFVKTLIHRGRVALREKRMKVTTGDYTRLLQKHIEANPAPARTIMWFDNLDSRGTQKNITEENQPGTKNSPRN